MSSTHNGSLIYNNIFGELSTLVEIFELFNSTKYLDYIKNLSFPHCQMECNFTNPLNIDNDDKCLIDKFIQSELFNGEYNEIINNDGFHLLNIKSLNIEIRIKKPSLNSLTFLRPAILDLSKLGKSDNT